MPTVSRDPDLAGRARLMGAVLDDVGSPRCRGIEVFVVDPWLRAGARDLGQLVRRRGGRR